MAVFENWDLFGIRMHRKRHPQDELFKVVNLDGQWRLSSVVRKMHTHLVTIEHVPPEDHQTQADRYEARATALAAKREALLKHLGATQTSFEFDDPREADDQPLSAA
jgi:hypothetical protein